MKLGNKNACTDIIYERPWGHHKNGVIQFVYNSGSYGTENKILNGKITESKVVEVPGGYYGEYARDHGFTYKEG